MASMPRGVQTTAVEEIPVVVFLFDEQDASHREMARQFWKRSLNFARHGRNASCFWMSNPAAACGRTVRGNRPTARRIAAGACTVFAMQYALADMRMS
jgi:hypothetical protein